MSIRSEIRGAGLISPVAVLEYRALTPNTPLLLTREPWNRKDKNAVVALVAETLQPCGYVAKEDAARIAPEMDEGVLWCAVVLERAVAMHWVKVRLWKPARGHWDRVQRNLEEHGLRPGVTPEKFMQGYLRVD